MPTGIGPDMGWSAIHDAARSDDLESLSSIVEARNGMPVRDIDMPSASGLTPLHVAGMAGANLCIAYLVAKQADWTLLDDTGRLALHWAADGGHTESIMHLVAAGQDINMKDKAGNAPLHIAARKGNVECCKYIIEIGADLSNTNARGWTPLQAATVPIYRVVAETLEKWIPHVNKIRRDFELKEMDSFLVDAGFDQFKTLFRKAEYSSHYMFHSTKPVSMMVLNSFAEKPSEKLNHREYMQFLETYQAFLGVKKTNPFVDWSKREQQWMADPETLEQYKLDHPGFDPENYDDSVYSRPALPKEQAYMDFLIAVIAELRSKVDKKGILWDYKAVKALPLIGIDGVPVVDDSKMEFDGIEDVVDPGWIGHTILDMQQIEKNVKDGMYTCWEMFGYDLLLAVCNVMVYCRAVRSDLDQSYAIAVTMAGKAARVLRKHRTSMAKLQRAKEEERREDIEKGRTKWVRWAKDRRLRGLLPDRYREALANAQQEGTRDEIDAVYEKRFVKASHAKRHWGYQLKDMVDIARAAWEEDTRAADNYIALRWMIDFTSSRDIERHFQHAAEDQRSDVHIPGWDVPGPYKLEDYLRSVIWPMDFEQINGRLAKAPEPDYYIKYPNNYRYLEQIALDWILTLVNCLHYHHFSSHTDMKKLLSVEQRPVFPVPKPPINVRIFTGFPTEHACKIRWEQPFPKPGEHIVKYRLALTTEKEQPIDKTRTGAKPGKVTDLEVTVEEKAANEPLEKIIKHFDTIASWKGGCCLLDGLAPCTEYSLVMRTLTDAGVTGPLSGPRLRFITKARVPDFPAMMRVDSVTDTLIIFSWDAPRDFGSAIEMYEVEYHDTFFHRTFVSLVNWNCRNLATRTILFSPATDDPLADGLQIAERPSVLLPSTLVHARLRARNPAGWSEWGHPVAVETKPAPSTPPQDMRLLATSPDTLDFAWMPPVIANSRAGIVGYRLDLTIVLSEAGGTVTRREDVSVDTLNGERLKFRFNHRPVTSKQRAMPGSEVPPTPTPTFGRRAGTSGSDSPRPPFGLPSVMSGGSEGGTSTPRSTGLGDVPPSPHPPNSEDYLQELNDLEEDDVVRFEEFEVLKGETPDDWWASTKFCGKVWFTEHVPLDVTRKASEDFPVICEDNNLIIFREMGVNGWSYEKHALMQPVCCTPEQLSRRLQAGLQGGIPIGAALRWSVSVSNMAILSITLQRQFQLKMAPTLAYAFGLIISASGWITSPEIAAHGLGDDKSVLVATYPLHTDTSVCNLKPVRTPIIHRVRDLPPGATVTLTVAAQNGSAYQEDMSGSVKRSRRRTESPDPAAAGSPGGRAASPMAGARMRGPVMAVMAANQMGKESPSSSPAKSPSRAQTPPRGESGKHLGDGGPLSPAPKSGLLGKSQEAAAGGSYLDLDSSLKRSGGASGKTECLLPPAPTRLEASGVLTSAIIIQWEPPQEASGAPILYLELCFFNPDGMIQKRRVDTASRGFQISGLRPGDTVTEIRIRSANQMGFGAYCRRECQATTFCAVPDVPLNFRVVSKETSSITFAWDAPVFLGGAPLVEWELSGFTPRGDLIVVFVPHGEAREYTIADPPHGSEGFWLLDCGVKCRNEVGWSKKAETCHARSLDGAPPHPDRMNARMREQNARQRAALDLLQFAIHAGGEAEKGAERAARQPARLKKALMEEAENHVMKAEELLVEAIQAAEESGFKAMGIAQPKEDIEARMLLERLRQKRVKRWGASRRGIMI